MYASMIENHLMQYPDCEISLFYNGEDCLRFRSKAGCSIAGFSSQCGWWDCKDRFWLSENYQRKKSRTSCCDAEFDGRCETGSGPAKNRSLRLRVEDDMAFDNLDKVMTNLQGVLSIRKEVKSLRTTVKKQNRRFCLDLVRYCGFGRFEFSVLFIRLIWRLNNTKPARKSRFFLSPVMMVKLWSRNQLLFCQTLFKNEQRETKGFYPYFWSQITEWCILFQVHCCSVFIKLPQHEYSSSWIRWQRTCSCLANETKQTLRTFIHRSRNAGTDQCGVNVNIAVSDFQGIRKLVLEEDIHLPGCGRPRRTTGERHSWFFLDPSLQRFLLSVRWKQVRAGRK